jgi:streptomycin 6-kinase
MHVLGEPIPEALVRASTNWGPDGPRWLESLPARVDELVDRWTLTRDGALLCGYCSIVVPVVSPDRGACVLKVQWPHDEAEHEADALRLYDGDGAARLFDEDDAHNAFLIERCVPGTPAWEAGETLAVCAGVMTRLWREVDVDAPFDRGALAGGRAEKIRRRFVEFGRPFDVGLADAGADMFDSLGASAPRSVLLHGDFHPDNVLRAEREPWLAIDPKPLVGDPAFDCAQLVLNFYGAWGPRPDRGRDMPSTIAELASAVGVEPSRAWGWTFARTVEEITWSLADGKPIEHDVEMATYFASLRSSFG